MNENEAIKILKTHNERCSGCDRLCNDMCKPAVEEAIKALAEIQQYRAIGIIEELTKTIKKNIDEKEAFRTLCKVLSMDFVLNEEGKFYVNKEDGSIWEKVGEDDRRIDDRGSLFISLRNVAVNIFPNLYFRSEKYIWKHPWDE